MWANFTWSPDSGYFKTTDQSRTIGEAPEQIYYTLFSSFSSSLTTFKCIRNSSFPYNIYCYSFATNSPQVVETLNDPVYQEKKGANLTFCRSFEVTFGREFPVQLKERRRRMVWWLGWPSCEEQLESCTSRPTDGYREGPRRREAGDHRRYQPRIDN